MFVTSNIMWVKSSITYAAGALFTKKSSTITYHKSYRHVQDLQVFFLVRNFKIDVVLFFLSYVILI